MGVETQTRKSHLPAPTDSPVGQTAGEDGIEPDLQTEVSRVTDKSSWTLPDDGREITIAAKRKKDKRDDTKLSKSSASQTSLLIEYFENGKVQARPSVRVKVTPSAARKIKNTNEHVTVSHSSGGRKPSYIRRISLGPHSPIERQVADSADDKSVSSYTSAAEVSSLAHRNPPVEIEVMHRDPESDLSQRSDDHMLLQNPSDVSSMPPDSMLEETHSSVKSSVTPTRNRSPSTSREAVIFAKDTLQTPQRTRSRNISKERLAHKAMEKIAAKSKEGSSDRQRRSRRTSRSRSASTEHGDTLTTPRRRSGKHRSYDGDSRTVNESSLASESRLSANRLSGEEYSVKSGTSGRSSINANPKLLETVENAIRFVMPELENIKEEQRLQRSKSKLEQDGYLSPTAAKMSRKLSKHSSAPDISSKPDIVLNRDEHGPGTVLSGDSVKGRKERRRSRKSDSPRERRSEREMSEETVIHAPQSASRNRSKEDHRLRESAASGSLTAAALQHHDLNHSDSRSTVESKERRRRRRSKSHSRSASVAESDDVFRKHDVPSMPLQSDIHSSDITRDSILSIDTEGSKSPTWLLEKATVRQLARASPREISSPGTRTPTKVQTLQKSLGVHHSNHSQGDLSQKSPLSEQGTMKEEKTSIFGGDKRAAIGGALASRSNYEDTYAHDGRALSPIQSVSSRQESEMNRESYAEQRARSAQSQRSGISLASDAFDHTQRPKGIHLESRDQVISQHTSRNSDYLEGEDVDEWLRREHVKNEEYRSSVGGPTVDYRHMTNYTDDSMDAPFLDRIAEGQKQHVLNARRNPDYRSTPDAVESAVASLFDTSVVSNLSKDGDKPPIVPPDTAGVRESAYSASGEKRSKESLGPQRHGLSPQRSYLHDTSAKCSPRQSIAQSEASEPVQLGASGVPVADDPIPEVGFRSDSDISTNPSIIQGPMAGTPAMNRDHWPYKPTPPRPQEQYLSTSKHSDAQENLKARAAELLSAAQLADQDKHSPRNVGSRDWSAEDGLQPPLEDDLESYADGRDLSTPAKDASPRVGVQSPEVAFKDATSPGLARDYDPFVGNTTNHARHISTNSGLARGMGSPLYDSATGEGIDRIQSKDIVALMDHLTVRDAQRNARDTEILVTLVRSAAEMRNSFEQMKRFIAEQDDIIVEAGNKQHDRTIQKIILGGPRPPPPKLSRRSSEDGADTSTKRQNVFRRALQGLSSRNSNDVGRIEDMLEHLLAEVESLKHSQGVQPLSRPQSRTQSLDSYHQMRAADPEDYAAQKTSGSPSNRNISFYPSPTGRGPSAVKPMVDRQASANRVSTVLEADEELSDHEQHVLDNQFERNEALLTPTKSRPYPDTEILATPPQAQLAAAAAVMTTKSAENTPKSSTEKSRKHKSTSSSIFPKVSRWSRTTASSFGDNFRSSRQQRPPSESHSRSGDLQHYDANEHSDPQADDRLTTNTSLEAHEQDQAQAGEEQRPPSPLVPSQVSEDVDPKYQSHRDSRDLQHPQPRQGPTQRYQRHLESQAQNYGGTRSPISPTSDTFGSDPTLARFMPGGRGSAVARDADGGAGNRYSMTGGHLSPISDAGYSEKSASEQAPPRPPKVKDEGPLVPANVLTGPQRPSKLGRSPLSQEQLGEGKRWSGASASEEAKRTPITQRKLTGPRPISTSGSYSPDKRRYRSPAVGNGDVTF